VRPFRAGVSFGALYEPVDEMARLGAEAEAGGFDALWVPDSPMLYRDPYAALALLARATRRARLGTLATNPLTRHPAVTAAAILTIHELSGGRAVLGLATGDSAVRRIGARPVRLAELAPSVTGIRDLLAGRTAGDAGGFAIRYAGTGATPAVYVVASGLDAIEVGARVADGVVVNVGAHPDVMRAVRERVTRGARAAGRKPEDVAVVAFFFCLLDDDPARARARVKPSVAWFCQRFPGLCALAGLPLDAAARAEVTRFEADYARYDLVHADGWARAVDDAAFLPDAYADVFALAGPAATVAAQLRAVTELGIDEVIIRPPSAEDWRPTVRAFARDVIPRLR
jgi:5,10-methylenetetrahydromethanopterin reductase